MAQTIRSGYFMSSMDYRHELNPAFAAQSNYINLPFIMLGNFDFNTQANVGVEDFLYKYNQDGYKLTTFMNNTVGTDEFLNKLNKTNRINANVSMPILSMGLHKWGGFNTMSIAIRSNNSINLPYSLFDFMKTGMSDEGGTHYIVEDITALSNSYVEIVAGHSRQIDERLRVGAKFKFLLGAANADANIRKMDIYMSENLWDIKADGELYGSMKGGQFKTKEPNDNGERELDGYKVKGAGVGGYGLAIDLGVVYQMDAILEGLTLSAALLDLGFIHWTSALKASMMHSYTFDGFKHPIVINAEEGDPGDLESQVDQIGDELKEFIKFYEDTPPKGRTTKLGARLNIGGEYTLPMYKKLRFGLLSSTYFNKPYTWTEARLSANIAPIHWFEASVNYAISHFGSSLGWVANFHAKKFSFFIGTDHMFTRITPQFVPIGNANTSVAIGFNILWGS